ncbi:MAG TPA: DMT family transporter [Candidatus Saccharimonadales bacterium]|nr:DMT family transporter [Candidatus Saccharimonadales bacterium]
MGEQATAILLGLSAAICYGLADFLGAAGSKKLGPITAACAVQILGLVGFGAWYLLAIHAVPHLSGSVAAAAVCGSGLVGLGLIFLYKAFAIGPVSLASPLGSAYPLVTVGVGVAFFHAMLSGRQLAGIGLVVLGVMVATGILSVKKSNRHLSQGPMFALLASAAWGAGYPFIDYAVTRAGWQSILLVELVMLTLTSVVALWLNRRDEHANLRQTVMSLRNPYIIGAGLVQLAATVLLNVGFVHDQTAGSLVVALTATYPIVTMSLALRHFKEDLSRSALLGAGATICGVVLMLL